jgi:hypothetical protein
MKAIVCALLGLLTASVGFSQQVGAVDLTSPIGVLSAKEQSSGLLPPGCTQEKPGIMSNGAITRTPGDNRPPRISLEIAKLSGDTLEVGGNGRAEVRLKNVGETPITVPWSTDSGLIQKAFNPDHLEWEQGSFQVVLRDKQNHTVALMSTDWPLYGSQVVSGSQLTIKPGEWIAAFLNFKVEDRYHIVGPAEFPVGEAKLFLKWAQALRVWDRKNCAWNTAWFDYEGYYEQEHPTATVQIDRFDSGKSKNSE